MKSTGDGVLVELTSIRDAVRCALDMQLRLAELEAGEREEERIKYRINDTNAHTDVSHLAPRVSVATLVCHSEGDRRIPLAEGRRLAALIPDAEFVALPGANHILTEGSEGFDLSHDRARTFFEKHAHNR